MHIALSPSTPPSDYIIIFFVYVFSTWGRHIKFLFSGLVLLLSVLLSPSFICVQRLSASVLVFQCPFTSMFSLLYLALSFSIFPNHPISWLDILNSSITLYFVPSKIIYYSRTPVYGHLTKPVTPPLWSPWLSPKWCPIVKYRTLVPVIRSPPYSGIRSVIPSQVAESPQYNGQSRPSSDNWLHIPLIQAAAGGRAVTPADDHKRDDNKRKPNTCWSHTMCQRSCHIDSD